MRRSTLTWTVVGYHPLACRDLAYNAARSWMWELDVCIHFGSQSLVVYDLEALPSCRSRRAPPVVSRHTSHAFRDSLPPYAPTKCRSSSKLFSLWGLIWGTVSNLLLTPGTSSRHLVLVKT